MFLEHYDLILSCSKQKKDQSTFFILIIIFILYLCFIHVCVYVQNIHTMFTKVRSMQASDPVGTGIIHGYEPIGY